MEVCTTREINLESCHFVKPVKETNGRVISKLMHKGAMEGLIVQSPKLVLQQSHEGGMLEFLVSKNKDLHRDFYHLISHLENIAIRQITENSAEWFPQKLSKSQVENMFRSSLFCPLEIDGAFVFRVQNEYENISENFPVVCLIRIDGIIFGLTSARLDMKVIKAKVVKPEPKLPTSSLAGQRVETASKNSFYSDAVSIAPARFNDLDRYSIHNTIEKIVEEPEVPITEKAESVVTATTQAPSFLSTPLLQSPTIEKAESVVTATKPITENVVATVEKAESVVTSTTQPPSFLSTPLLQSPTIEKAESVVTATKSMTEKAESVPTNYSYLPASAALAEEMDVESLKIELMRAVVENDFEKIQELNDKINLNA